MYQEKAELQEEVRASRSSFALYTDHYELTMLEAALESGIANRQAVFELFARKLPAGRRYGVVAGLGRVLEAIQSFSFSKKETSFLLEKKIIKEETAAWLEDYTFSGSITAYQEGEIYFPYSPLLTVESTFAQGVILETLLLSILNHDSAIASAAARMQQSSYNRPLLEMGSRRTHEEAAVACARVAYLCGFSATSNLEAGRRYNVPTKGTAAHAFTLGHAVFGDTDQAEKAAFTAQVRAQGTSTTLLVDTFDTAQGIKNAIAVAGPDLGAVRIDSGELAEEARKARILLDELGAKNTKIVLTGDLDEYSLEELSEEPVDSYGVGTKLVQGSGHPTASMVYKLVAIAKEENSEDLVPVAKKSSQKASKGGKKIALRLLERNELKRNEEDRETASKEVVLLENDFQELKAQIGEDFNYRLLQVPVIEKGKTVYEKTLKELRCFHQEAITELPAMALDLTNAPPILETFTSKEEVAEFIKKSKSTKKGKILALKCMPSKEATNKKTQNKEKT